MSDFFTSVNLGDLSGPTILVTVAVLVITRKLVWYKDVQKLEARVERLEKMLWDSLVTTGRAVEVSEAAADVLTRREPPEAD